MDHSVADLNFFLFVHERFAHVRIVSVFHRGAANQRRPIRNRFLALGQRKVLARWQDWRCRPDGAYRSHVNVLSSKRGERTSGTGVGDYEGEGWYIRVIQRAGDV